MLFSSLNVCIACVLSESWYSAQVMPSWTTDLHLVQIFERQVLQKKIVFSSGLADSLALIR